MSKQLTGTELRKVIQIVEKTATQELLIAKAVAETKNIVKGGVTDNALEGLKAIVESAKKAVQNKTRIYIKPCFWVIKSSNTAYYQIVKADAEKVYLIRRGVQSSYPIVEFYQLFYAADEKDTKEHEKWCDTNSVTYIAPAPIVAPAPAPTKPQDAEFYCVTLKQGVGCTKLHATYDLAVTEATRLSKQEGKKAYIMGVVGVVDVVPVTTYDVKVERF